MDWAAIQAAIKAWLAGATGLAVVWENEPRPALLRHLGFCVLGTPSDITPMGQDWLQYATAVDPDELVATVVGQRIFTVPVRVISRNQSSPSRHYTERARLTLKMPSVLGTLADAGLAIVRADKTVQYDAPFDERVESIASFELTFAAVASLAELGADLGTIGTMELSSDLDSDAGPVPVPPSLDAETIQIDP